MRYEIRRGAEYLLEVSQTRVEAWDEEYGGEGDRGER